MGTALLRIRSFLPTPVLIDFSAFYTAAAAVRQKIVPYALPVEWLKELKIRMAIPGYPPAIFNPPLWPWLLQPFAVLRYPTAAWVWLLIQIGLLIWVTYTLNKHTIIRLSSLKLIQKILDFIDSPVISRTVIEGVILFIFILTFGPVFLDMSIGQTSILLLALCCVIGLQFREQDTFMKAIITGLAMGLATVAKLYPLAWIAPYALLRRWKSLATCLVFTFLVFILGFLLLPEANQMYWQKHLPQRIFSAADQVSVDDQSLVSWLDRIFRSHTFNVPGLQTRERREIIWMPLWQLNPLMIRILGYGLCVLLGIMIILVSLQAKNSEGEGIFYLWVLYIIVVFPHMERYNLTLLLPAMAWLCLRKRFKLVIFAYFLSGLSRLNHLWIRLLPVPWSPIASGFGLVSVLTLIWGILTEYRTYPQLEGHQ
jgi:alpha-1,2-mannosyltransferase